MSDDDPTDYAWAMTACPHCDAGMLIGIKDEDWHYDDFDAMLAVAAPTADDTDN